MNRIRLPGFVLAVEEPCIPKYTSSVRNRGGLTVEMTACACSADEVKNCSVMGDNCCASVDRNGQCQKQCC